MSNNKFGEDTWTSEECEIIMNSFFSLDILTEPYSSLTFHIGQYINGHGTVFAEYSRNQASIAYAEQRRQEEESRKHPLSIL